MLGAIAFSALLCCLSAALIVWHVRRWRFQQSTFTDPGELAFAARQFRRRLQTSSMLGVVGIAIGLGQLIPSGRFPTLFVCYWFAVFLVTLWLMLLALGDAVVTRIHESQREHRQAMSDLAREVRRRRAGDADELPDRSDYRQH